MTFVPHDLSFEHLCVKPHEIDMVIYHNQCTDGFMARTAAELYANENGLKFEYFPGIFNSALPKVEGKNVAVFDFSYKKKDMEMLLKYAKNIVIIDHHKTAEEDLSSVPEKNKVFNMNYSGAVLAWHYFFPNSKLPLVFEYVQDNDLWQKKLPNTNEFCAKMFVTPFTFEDYSAMLNEENVKKTIEQGKVVLEYQNSMVKTILKTSTVNLMEVNSKLYIVATVNSSVLKSELGARLFELHPYADFSVVYNIDDLAGHTIYSLRSTNDRADVGKICASWGSGGHRNAGGHREKSQMYNIPGTELMGGNMLKDVIKSVTTQKITIGKRELNAAIVSAKNCSTRMAGYLVQMRNATLQEAQFICNKFDIIYDVGCVWYSKGHECFYSFAFTNYDVAKECYDYLCGCSGEVLSNTELHNNDAQSVITLVVKGIKKDFVF